MKKQFIKILSNMLGVDNQSSMPNVDELEQLVLANTSEIEQLKSLVSVLVMTSPHIRVADTTADTETEEDIIMSGSSERVLN